MKAAVQKSFITDGEERGKLYLVATPIGNLDDMTFRAINTLKSCSIIAAEDTRQTRKLLTHFDITPEMLFSYHEHNKAASGPELIRYIIEGKNLALVSDAGLPVPFRTRVRIWSSWRWKRKLALFPSLGQTQHCQL